MTHAGGEDEIVVTLILARPPDAFRVTRACRERRSNMERLFLSMFVVMGFVGELFRGGESVGRVTAYSRATMESDS